ncbi:hypothetical protein LX36DRAFT_616683, partial [Colletotrichum falcatum]
MGERTGSRVLRWVWSYVPEKGVEDAYNDNRAPLQSLRAKYQRPAPQARGFSEECLRHEWNVGQDTVRGGYETPARIRSVVWSTPLAKIWR